MAERTAAGGGWFLPTLGISGLQGLSDWLLGKEESKRYSEGLAWEKQKWADQLAEWAKDRELQVQLQKMKGQLPPEIYNRLMGELTKPLIPHGVKSKVGSFQDLVGLSRGATQTQPTQRVNLQQFFGGGGR